MREEKTNLEEAKVHLEAYISNHLELAKIELAEKSSKVAASVAVSISTVVLVLIALGFLSFAAAFYVGMLLSGFHWGFLVVGGFYLLILLFLTVFGKSFFHRFYTNRIINKIFSKHEW